MRVLLLPWAAALGAVLAALPAAGAVAPTAAGRLALLAVQDPTGDSAAAAGVEATLREQLGGRGWVVLPTEEVRDVLRRRRLRSGEATAPAVLAEVAAELDVDRLLSATLHEADRRQVPRLAVSARAYGPDGELVWAGFTGRSGLAGRTVLGLGVVDEIEALAAPTVRELLADLPPAAGPAPEPRRIASTGRVAVLPFESVVETEATLAAEAVAQAALAALYRRGVEVISPSRVAEVLRRQGSRRWGGIDGETRRAVAEAGADFLLVGTVEAWGDGGDDLEPEPEVTVGLRLVDAASGRLLWTGAGDRRGWDRQGPFRLGRVYSRGVLTRLILETLTDRLLADWPVGSTETGN
jgi:TolB-like protein